MSSSNKNSSEALFLRGNPKKENKTQSKYSKGKILANIEINISTSINAEDITSNDLEQIIPKNTDLIKSNQTGNIYIYIYIYIYIWIVSECVSELKKKYYS